MNKKGDNLLLMIFEVMVVIMVIFITIKIARAYGSSDFVVRNNFAEDIRLMVNTLVGVPGDAVVYYPYNVSQYVFVLNSMEIIIYDQEQGAAAGLSKNFFLPKGYRATGSMEGKSYLCLEKGGKGILLRECRERDPQDLTSIPSPSSEGGIAAAPASKVERWFFCSNKCTAVENDCTGQQTKEFSALAECQKKVPITGRVIFIPVNWDGKGILSLMKPQFDSYLEMYKVKKEAVYLEEKCAISGIEEQKNNENSRIKLNDCVRRKFPDFSIAKDIVVGVVQEGTIKNHFRYQDVIFMFPELDVAILSHEIGHLSNNYCDEYVYSKPESVVIYEETEELDLSFSEFVERAYSSLANNPNFKNVHSEFLSHSTAKITYEGKEKAEQFEAIFSEAGMKVNIKITVNFEYGWKYQNLERGCPNHYPGCCQDSPDWNNGLAQIYGINCYPSSLPGPQPSYCVGGPCANPKSPLCRSVMGYFWVKNIIHGLPT